MACSCCSSACAVAQAGLALLHAEAKQAVRHQAQAAEGPPDPAEKQALAEESKPDGPIAQSEPPSSEPAEQKQQIAQKASLPAEPEDKRVIVQAVAMGLTSALPSCRSTLGNASEPFQARILRWGSERWRQLPGLLHAKTKQAMQEKSLALRKRALPGSSEEQAPAAEQAAEGAGQEPAAKRQRAELGSQPNEGQQQIAQEVSPTALAAEPEGRRIIAHRQGLATTSRAICLGLNICSALLRHAGSCWAVPASTFGRASCAGGVTAGASMEQMGSWCWWRSVRRVRWRQQWHWCGSCMRQRCPLH